MSEFDKLLQFINNAPQCTMFSEEAKRSLVQNLLNNGVKVPPVKIGDFLWTDIGETEFVIMQTEVTSVRESKEGYDIWLNLGTKDYHITEEDIGKTFFYTEEEANATLLP